MSTPAVVSSSTKLISATNVAAAAAPIRPAYRRKQRCWMFNVTGIKRIGEYRTRAAGMNWQQNSLLPNCCYRVMRYPYLTYASQHEAGCKAPPSRSQDIEMQTAQTANMRYANTQEYCVPVNVLGNFPHKIQEGQAELIRP